MISWNGPFYPLRCFLSFFFFNHSSRSEARAVSLSWIEPDNHRHLRRMAWWVSTQAHTRDWLQARPRTSPAPGLLLKSPWFFSFCIFPVFWFLSSGISFGISFAWDPCTWWPLEAAPPCCLCNTLYHGYSFSCWYFSYSHCDTQTVSFPHIPMLVWGSSGPQNVTVFWRHIYKAKMWILIQFFSVLTHIFC